MSFGLVQSGWGESECFNKNLAPGSSEVFKDIFRAYRNAPQTFRQRTFRQPTLRQRTFRQLTFGQNRQGGHFANLIFFSSKLRSYYHKPHDNDSTKVLYNKISNTLVLCRCISLESSCTTYMNNAAVSTKSGIHRAALAESVYWKSFR